MAQSFCPYFFFLDLFEMLNIRSSEREIQCVPSCVLDRLLLNTQELVPWRQGPLLNSCESEWQVGASGLCSDLNQPVSGSCWGRRSPVSMRSTSLSPW